jgi:DNA invertase Pin-like site-specific DNA recombinase
MTAQQYVAYYRVSTERQGFSGLGLEAQRAAVQQFLAKTPGKLVAEFSEIKSGSRGLRPQLAEALRVCRMRRAVLLIARLDRLARNVALISSLMDSDLEFVAVDFPQATRLTLHVLAAIAEYESGIISERLKAAFAAAKARGVKLGGPRGKSSDMSVAVAASVAARRIKTKARAMDLAPIVWDLKAKGRSIGEIADEFNRQRIETPNKRKWHSSGVQRILRLTASEFRSLAETAKTLPRPQSRRAQVRAEALAPLVWELTRRGMSLTSIAEELNRREVATPRAAKWRNSTVLNILRRTAASHGSIIEARDVDSPGRRSMHAKQRAFDLAPLLWKLRGDAKSLAAMAEELRRRNIRAPCGGTWRPSAVRRILLLTASAYAPDHDIVTAVRLGRHPEERKRRAMEVAPTAWQLRADGKAVSAIADELNRRKIATPHGRPWRFNAVRNVLKLTASEFPSLGEAAAGRSNLHVVRMKQALELGPVVWKLRRKGTSTNEIAVELTRQGIEAPEGKRRWTVKTVGKILRSSAAEFGPAGEEKILSSRRVRADRRAKELAPVVWELKAAGRTNPEIAAELDRRGVPTPKGGRWQPSAVQRILSLSANEFASLAEAATACPHHHSIRARERAKEIAPIAWKLRSSGRTLASVADEMNRQNLTTPRNGKWCIARVWRLLQGTADAFGPTQQAA